MTKLACVNLGLPKSGTSTLAEALRAAKWHVADHKLRRGYNYKRSVVGQFVGALMYKGYFETGNPFHEVDFAHALCEINVLNSRASCWPQCDYTMLKAMRLHGRGVKFVATYRAPEEIADSMRRWNNLGTVRLPAADVPGLPRGFGRSAEELVTWITAHYDMLDDVFGQSGDYLRLDVSAPDAPAQLAAHLDIKLPWWGRANVNTENPAYEAAS